MKTIMITIGVLLIAALSQQSQAQNPVEFKGAAYGDPSRSAGGNAAIMFEEQYNLKKYSKLEDIIIKWKVAQGVTVAKALVIDLTSDDMDIIWTADNFAGSEIKYEAIKDKLSKPFVEGHTYKLNLTLSNNTSASYDFIFGK